MFRNGTLSNTPFLITRTWPPWRQIKSRPSGANAIAVGVPDRSLPTCVSINPGGKFAAVASKGAKASQAAMTDAKVASNLREKVTRIAATSLHSVATKQPWFKTLQESRRSRIRAELEDQF